MPSLPLGVKATLTPEALAAGLKGHRILVQIKGSEHSQVVLITGEWTDKGIEVVAVKDA